MNTPDELRKLIEDGIASNLAFRDNDHDAVLEQLWLILFDTTKALTNITDKIDPTLLPDKEFSYMLVLTNCIVDIHSSYHLVRAGFHRAAAIVARGMLENMAVAISMKGDESDGIFNQYQSGTYKITSAVTTAKTHFPEVGTLYGVLSNKFAHEPYESIGRAFVQNGRTTTLLLLPPVGRNGFLVQFVLILNLAMLICTLGQVIEWTLAIAIAPSIFWEKDGGNLKRKPAESFLAVKVIGAKLEQLLKEKTPLHPPQSKPKRES